MRSRIHEIDAGAEDRDGFAAGFEGGLMRRGIDATGESGNDRHAGRHELPRQMRCGIQSVGRGATRSHHRHHRPLQQRQIAAIEKRERRIDDLAQQSGVLRIDDRNRLAAKRIDLPPKIVLS